MSRRIAALILLAGSLLVAQPIAFGASAPLPPDGPESSGGPHLPSPWAGPADPVAVNLAPFDAPEQQEEEPIEPGYVEGQLIVRFKPGTTDEVKRRLHEQFGAQVISEIPDRGVQLLRLSDEALASVSAYQARSEVAYAEPNYIASVLGYPVPATESGQARSSLDDELPNSATSDDIVALQELSGIGLDMSPDELMVTPNDPMYTSQWHHAKIDSPRAWDYSRGTGIVVAVVDTGTYCGHVDLVGKCVAGYDFVNSDSDPADDHGHGTHVAGIAAAATNNGIGVAGTGWDARVMPIKSLTSAGRGSHYAIASGIDWAVDHGADVVNLSLGSYFTSTTLQQSVARAIAAGVTVFAAAGNDAVSNPTYPATYPGVIGVAATTSSDGRASFSNYGDFVDIAAPGVGILSTVMTGSYQAWNGTSMASPVAAGVGALLLAQDPSRTPAQIQYILETTAVDLGSPGRDSLFGAGRINAGAALASHGGPPVTPTPAGPTPTFGPPTASPTPASDWIQQLEDLLNQERLRYGLPALQTDLSLRAASGRHSSDMSASSFCSHYGSDGSSPYTRMRDAGYSRPYGEIIVCGTTDPASSVQAWMNSPDHRALILCTTCTELGGGHAGTGVGYRNYWTVTFGMEAVSGPTPTPLQPPTPSATFTPAPPTLTPSPSPTPPNIPPGGTERTIPAANNRVGWVVSVQPDRNYFTDDDTFTGSYNGRIYHGAMQFDLDDIPVGAYVNYARLELTGRTRQFLGTTGTWSVRLLDTAIDEGFAGHGYTDIHSASAEGTLLPLLGVGDLGETTVNVFTLVPSQVAALQNRVAGSRRISFRVDGPTSDTGMNLFTWDTGYGPETRYPGPKLIVHYTLSPPTAAPSATPTGTAPATEIPPTPTDGPTPTPTDTPVPPTATATAPPTPIRTPTPTDIPPIDPTPGEGGLVEIAPACGDVGWVKQGEPGNHFCTAETFTGYYQGYQYHGAMQFDLSAIPQDSEIVSARLMLTGQTTQYLSRFGNGRWRIAMLSPDIDLGWRGHSFNRISSASTLSLLRPELLQGDLDSGRRNVFVFDDDQIRYLSDRLHRTGKISFRADGPRAGTSNVFSWGTGYGAVEPPILSVVFGPPGSGDNPLPTPDPQTVEQILDLIRRVNVEREKAGVRPVVVSEDLERAAREHNLDMAWNDFFSHTGSDGSEPFERVDRTGYRAAAVGELLAAATSDVNLIVDAWMGIDYQQDVLLDPRWREVGVHYTFRTRTAYRHYWTLVMAEPAP